MNIDNRKVNWGRVAILVAGLTILLFVIIFAGVFIFNSFNTKLESQEEIRCEVGDEIVLEPELFLINPTDKTLEEVTMSSPLMKNSEKYDYNKSTGVITTMGKDYLEVGIYQVNFKLGNNETTSKLIVEDTTAPVIKETANEHRVPLYTEKDEFDFKSMITITDYSDYDVVINSNAVNFNQEGVYPVTFTAKDIYGNETQEVISLIVGDTTYYATEESNDYTILDEDEDKDASNSSVNYTDDDFITDYDDGTEDDEDSWAESYSNRVNANKKDTEVATNGTNSHTWENDYSSSSSTTTSNKNTSISTTSSDSEDSDKSTNDIAEALKNHVSSMVFDSAEAGNKAIMEADAGVTVSWQIETTDDGKTKFIFSYN